MSTAALSPLLSVPCTDLKLGEEPAQKNCWQFTGDKPDYRG
jgi:hypothetical protein